ncbi:MULTISPECIES: PepSY-associated TM helix domain-containing protein [Rhodopseudomonas]|uniref:PepSY-associated TM helix domain-containing protein n=1 Tax=Rhodopseudomonas TaxID=1073 RepID=UPI0009BA5689|nr:MULTISPECIES: PepSY-associated TM helix domain-containing protein [Rhodopseudomonas]MDF3811596.1 PepSY-associated TM helix domain-containing protein [Rhodopseudomonas sp. BAL398]WOK19918.1 PepSY-associated TM helix domain-containing protein [Rhodopseudomonas sp. BAL398]
MSRTPIKASLRQVHSIIGLAIGLLLTLIGITGATMSFEDEIGAWLNAAIMRVEPRPAPLLTPDALVARLRAARDVGKLSAVTLSRDRSAAAWIRFARDESGVRPDSLYLDPYDGRILGTPRGERFFATVRKLHRWLLLPGDGKGIGRQITGVVAIGLIVMLISGLVLRWPRRAGSVKAWLKPNLAMRGRGLHWSLHSVAGTWVMLIYLTMALTGLWYSFDWYRAGAVWLLSDSSKAAASPKAMSPRVAGATAPGFDRAWATFLQAQGQRYAMAQLTLPPGRGTVLRIRSWRRGSEDSGERDEFRIDGVSGRVVSAQIYADKPLGERVLARVLDIHRGAILGWPGRLLFMIAAALMPLFMVTGLLLYLSRRKLRPQRGASGGRPAADCVAPSTASRQQPGRYLPAASAASGARAPAIRDGSGTVSQSIE